MLGLFLRWSHNVWCWLRVGVRVSVCGITPKLKSLLLLQSARTYTRTPNRTPQRKTATLTCRRCKRAPYAHSDSMKSIGKYTAHTQRDKSGGFLNGRKTSEIWTTNILVQGDCRERGNVLPAFYMASHPSGPQMRPGSFTEFPIPVLCTCWLLNFAIK